MQHQKTVIIIVGPTASGKTALSIQLAGKLQTSIISADSRQCFRELNIGVAKPSPEMLQRVKHYFINSHSIRDNVTAQTFEQYALTAVEEIFSKSNYAIMAGGTGLYIKAFCEGLDEIPEADAVTRKFISEQFDRLGIAWLQKELQTKDANFWESAEQQNPRRLMRALEVIYATGKSITSYRRSETKERPFNIIKFGIEIAKEQLHENINQRVDLMIKEGLVEEVKSLLEYKNLNALQTVGYRELIDFFEKGDSLGSAIEKIKQNTRHYAKRQMTWFRKDKSIKWMKAQEIFAGMDIFLS